MATAADIMTSKVITTRPDTIIWDAALVLLEQRSELHRVNPGDRDVSTDAVHDQCAKQKPQPTPGEAGSGAFTKL